MFAILGLLSAAALGAYIRAHGPYARVLGLPSGRRFRGFWASVGGPGPSGVEKWLKPKQGRDPAGGRAASKGVCKLLQVLNLAFVGGRSYQSFHVCAHVW